MANCPAEEHLGSGYIIYNFTKELQKYFLVDFFDTRDYEILKQLQGRATLIRQAIGKCLLLIKLLWLQKRKYQLIEFWGGDSFLAMQLIKHLYKKTMMVHHSNGLESKYLPIRKLLESSTKWYHFNYQFLYDSTIKLPYGVITLTKKEAKWARDKYMVKSEGIYPALPSFFLQSNSHYQNKKKIIGFVGTWLKKKGIDLIINDLPIVLQKYPDYKLQLIGVGNPRPVLQNFPEACHAQIEIISFVNDKQALLGLYQEMQILILPSKIESFGMVTLEAMSAGCAIIASEMGYAGELAEYVNCLLLKKWHKGVLTDKIEELISTKDLITQMGENNYQLAKNASWNNAGKQLATIYNNWYKTFSLANGK